MVQAVPGSLSEGAAERSEAEGVYFGERKRSKISEFICAGGKSLAWRNHRGTLPQSRPFGRASSLREGAGNDGGLYHSTGYSLNRKGAGDFHRPYETQNGLRFTIQRAARKPGRCGRFSSPLRRAFSIHWGARKAGGAVLFIGDCLKVGEKSVRVHCSMGVLNIQLEIYFFQWKV